MPGAYHHSWTSEPAGAPARSWLPALAQTASMARVAVVLLPHARPQFLTGSFRAGGLVGDMGRSAGMWPGTTRLQRARDVVLPGERGALTWFLTGRSLRERLGWSPGLFTASQRRCAERPPWAGAYCEESCKRWVTGSPRRWPDRTGLLAGAGTLLCTLTAAVGGIAGRPFVANE